MAIGDIFKKKIPNIIGGPFRPPVEVPGQAQPQAQAGLPLVIQQLYGGVPFTPGADTMEAGFRTSPGFRPGAPVNINMPAVAPTRPGFIDFMPKIPGVPFGAQTTLADLSAFNPVANQYALAGFTVGEILAMPEFADFAQFQAQQTGGTATSAGLAALEERLRERGSPEDRGSYSDRFGTAEDQGFSFSGGSGQYKNPNDPFGDTFSPAPGIGTAFDQYGRRRNIGVTTDLGLNIANLVGPFAKAKPGIFGVVNKVTDVFKNYREKKAKEEREARIAEEKKEQLEKINEIKKQLEERKKKKQEKEAKDKADRDKAQRTGTGFKTERDRDTATGKFSGPKGDGPGKGGPTGPGGQTSGPPGREGPGR
jgi:hypothetical protein